KYASGGKIELGAEVTSQITMGILNATLGSILWDVHAALQPGDMLDPSAQAVAVTMPPEHVALARLFGEGGLGLRCSSGKFDAVGRPRWYGRAAPQLSALPHTPWESVAADSCDVCGAPLSGEVLHLRGVTAPKAGLHNSWTYQQRA